MTAMTAGAFIFLSACGAFPLGSDDTDDTDDSGGIYFSLFAAVGCFLQSIIYIIIHNNINNDYLFGLLVRINMPTVIGVIVIGVIVLSLWTTCLRSANCFAEQRLKRKTASCEWSQPAEFVGSGSRD